jgi:hypothetical protein
MMKYYLSFYCFGLLLLFMVLLAFFFCMMFVLMYYIVMLCILCYYAFCSMYDFVLVCFSRFLRNQVTRKGSKLKRWWSTRYHFPCPFDFGSHHCNVYHDFDCMICFSFFQRYIFFILSLLGGGKPLHPEAEKVEVPSIHFLCNVRYFMRCMICFVSFCFIVFSRFVSE